jgi:tRNA(Ile)-lysidine synthase
MSLQQAFLHNWNNHFTTNNGSVLLAISGGMDSMALANLMFQSQIPFALAHCNFKLRNEASDMDEQHVRDWAQKHNIIFHTISFDTEKEMKLRKTAVQETARNLRYEWFHQLCKEHKYSAIATAHHANDNAETLLINLCKGTGIAGLHAIPEHNENIIRPLLFATRKQIEEYITAECITYREDASNSSNKYLRNAVRHKIIPALNELFPDVVQQLSNNIKRFSEAEILYNKAIEEERKKLLEKRGADFYIPILKLKKRIPLATICYELFTPFGFSAAQTLQIINLIDSESGHFINSATHRIIRDRQFLIITTLASEKTDLILIDKLPDTVIADGHKFIFTEESKSTYIDASDHVAIIDSKQITLPIQLRKWRTGDYFYPLGMGMKKKKISRFLIDKKIPLHQKEQLWLVENNKRIVWIAGMRLDERFKVLGNTEKVLVIKMVKL